MPPSSNSTTSARAHAPFVPRHLKALLIVMCCCAVVGWVFTSSLVAVQPLQGRTSRQENAAQALVGNPRAIDAAVTSVHGPDGSGVADVGFPVLLREVPLVDDTGAIPTRDHGKESFLVVVGIPTTDTEFGLHRRRWQRSSWFTYQHVWDRKTGRCRRPAGTCMLVKYLVGKHPRNNYEFSSSLREESRLFGGDLVGLSMREGAPSTGKKSGGAGYWGLEAEVGMSRKALHWYTIASQLYVSDYVMKGDDDVFIRVPQYIHDLRALQHRFSSSSADGGSADRRLYWGAVMKWGAVKGDPRSVFYFVGGMSITLSTDLTKLISSHQPIQEHAGPFESGGDSHAASPEEVKRNYKAHNMDHEDVMIGRIFYNLRVNVTMVKDCRFHDVHTGANIKKITSRSLVVHHLKEDEYATLLMRFGEDDVSPTEWHTTSAKSYHIAVSPC